MGDYLRNFKNLPILDADVYSKEALDVNQTATKEVIARYGKAILKKKAQTQIINRSALGEIIFSNKKERIWLENLLHPIIEKKFEMGIIKYKNNPIIILVIPLLFESKFINLCSESWLVYCTVEQQYQRLISRNGLTHDEAKQRICSQISIEKKRRLADKIIDNSQNLAACYQSINESL